MIKALFFDFDGVLTLDRTGSLTTTRYISVATGIDHARVTAAFATYNDDLTRGRCTHAEVWAEICNDLMADVDIALLERAFASTPLNVEMLALATRLRPSYIIGVITDNKQDRMDCIEGLHGLSYIFQPIVVSAAVGSTKTDRAIFEHALALADVAPSECIFIDNSARNLAVPRAMGIDAIHFDDEANDIPKLIGELRERHVVVGDAR
jgi:putative hydrolase of the HAD superfamily